MSDLSTFVATHKYCSKCGAVKPVSEFSKNCRTKDGLWYRCRACVSASYRQDREKVAARGRQYRERNKEKLKASSRTPAGLTTRLWYSLNRRTINGSHPNWKSKSCRRYLEQGIRLEMTRNELGQFVEDSWVVITAIWAIGELASIDRIDSKAHYSLDNVRFISMCENARLGGKRRIS